MKLIFRIFIAGLIIFSGALVADCFYKVNLIKDSCYRVACNNGQCQCTNQFTAGTYGWQLQPKRPDGSLGDPILKGDKNVERDCPTCGHGAHLHQF